MAVADLSRCISHLQTCAGAPIAQSYPLLTVLLVLTGRRGGSELEWARFYAHAFRLGKITYLVTVYRSIAWGYYHLHSDKRRHREGDNVPTLLDSNI